MNRITGPMRLTAAIAVVGLLAACGDDNAAASEDFCDTMQQVTTLLEPDTGATTPEGTEARYDEIATLLDEARQTAPPAIANDISTFAGAVDEYASALEAVDYDIDTLFSTLEGEQRAQDTSHALTPGVIDHLTGPCDLALG